MTRGRRSWGKVRRVTGGHKETFGCDGYVHYLDFVTVSWVSACVNTNQILHFKHAYIIVRESCLIKVITLKFLNIWNVNLAFMFLSLSNMRYRKIKLKKYVKVFFFFARNLKGLLRKFKDLVTYRTFHQKTQILFKKVNIFQS